MGDRFAERRDPLAQRFHRGRAGRGGDDAGDAGLEVTLVVGEQDLLDPLARAGRRCRFDLDVDAGLEAR
jgi:hypothetical protein